VLEPTGGAEFRREIGSLSFEFGASLHAKYLKLLISDENLSDIFIFICILQIIDLE
jgi:hypothetical protein